MCWTIRMNANSGRFLQPSTLAETLPEICANRGCIAITHANPIRFRDGAIFLSGAALVQVE